ncbi:zinc finger protein 518A [Carcharodon carcharias]|uniref:zinc finger protein 518A n=1 Tax=Carcharodon carcharias TaxID=13397 RepID=UPI001B7DB928|nr:zinc finger protein 518A [Carcharodon carcharias]XP_041065680.1 zinc finger protein 518A [Carcharodon carcharias]XP_041065681.1 zinc finger protein 518A [Carcharodon carcharias]XP_041065682.1 zinc finger protein 518A [Carcharodon carcharias]XP_041065683.1 zinc finger protein 518A [Carcharodon carcharias]XP_041065684.1 zinc finger protein 518A [Carcharodon carcharias]XP_041065685.1 zinc finger protein 518A [Carcharodon carcharias]XP_041065686.1 zinc finger protein 518A [Carcharodon carchar
MQSDQRNFAQISDANAFVDSNSKKCCRKKLSLPTGNFLQKDKGFVAQKCARSSSIPSVTVNKHVNKESSQELKLKLKNAKVVLSRLDVKKKISPYLLVNQSKTSLSRSQTARKSLRRESLAQVDHRVISFKDSSVQQSLGETSKTSEGVAKAVLVKVLRFSCEKCKDGAEYNPKQLLKHYQELHAADLPVYPCELCSFTANDFQTLSQHRLKHRTPLLKCEVCNDGKMYTLQELRRHLNWKHGVNGNFRCEKCRFSTKDQGTFIQHIHRHDVIQYKCGKCEHVSYTKGEFQRHLVVHTGAFPFCCQYCKYGATRKDYIIKHINAVHKGLAEGSSSKTEMDPCQKGKLKNSAGLKLVLKRYKNGVSRKAQWRKKRHIPNLAPTKDNAKRSDDATKKVSYQEQQSRPAVVSHSNEEVVSPKDISAEKDEIPGPKPTASTSSPQKTADVSGSNQKGSKVVSPRAPVVILKNNKLSVPPNYSAQFMGFKVVSGKQHLVIKLMPTCKQNLSASNSQTLASNGNSLCLPQNAGNSNVRLPGTNASSVNAQSIRLSNLFTSQPRAFMVMDNSAESKMHTSGPQVSHVSSVTNGKFTQVKTLEPLFAGMSSSQTGKLLPTSSSNLTEATVNKDMPDSQVIQNKTTTSVKSSVSNNSPTRTLASSTISQIAIPLRQYLNEQTSSGKKMSQSDCDASLQSINGTHLPFIHNYAKVNISTSKQSGGLIVQGDNSKTGMISQQSEAVPQSSFKAESSSGQPHKVEASGIQVSNLQQLQCIVTSQASIIPKYGLLNGKVSTAGVSISSKPSFTNVPSHVLLGCRNPGGQGLNELNSPILLQMLEPSEIVNEESDAESKLVSSKNIPMSSTLCTSSATSNCNFLFTSSELGAETLNIQCDELCNNSMVNYNLNSCSALLNATASEQSICPINVKEPNQVNYEKCLYNLNNFHATEVPISGMCQSAAEAEALKKVTVRSCTTVQSQQELRECNSNWSPKDWACDSEANTKLQNTEEDETISELFLEKSNCRKVDVEMMDSYTKDNMNQTVSAEDFLEEQVSDSDGSVSPVMPRITSVFSLRTGDGMSCLAPEENQLLLNALKGTSIFGDENPCSEPQCPKSSPTSFLERQTSTHTATNKMALHNYSIKEESWAMQLDSLNDSCVLDNEKCLGERSVPQTPPKSSSCMPPNVEKLNTLLKTHSAEIINQQLIKDAIRTSANGGSNSSVAPVALLGPLRLAGITKPLLIQPSQKGSAVPLHLTKQSRLQVVSGGSIPQTKVVTGNSASLPDKGPGLILTFSNGTLGAVASIVCGGNPPILDSTRASMQGQTLVTDKSRQNTCPLTSSSRVGCMKTTPVNVLSSKDSLPKGSVSAVFDHHSYAKLAFDTNDSHSAEKGSLNINGQDAHLCGEQLENVKSTVSNNSLSFPLRQEVGLGNEGMQTNRSTENEPDQQTVVLQCIMQKKPTGVTSEETVANSSFMPEENGPLKKILLRFVKSSNGESGMKGNQFLKNPVAFHNDAAGSFTKPLQQPTQAVLFTGGSPCILLPVSKPVPSIPANDGIPPQIHAQASLKLPIPPALRSSSIRSAERRNTNKASSVTSQRSATKSNCRWDNEKSDELWQPRKSCNENFVFRYSKRLKNKLENSENPPKMVTSSFSQLKGTEEREQNKPPEVNNMASSRRIVKTLRLVPFDHGQLIRCPRRNQPVIVLNHPDVDVPEVVNVMKTIKKCKGNVLKVVLSKRTICALLNSCSSVQVATKGFLINQCKKIKPVSPVKERYVLKLKLKKTSKNNYQIVKSISSKTIDAKFSCWFCGRIFDNQEDWVGHGQRHLMEATRDWNILT